MGYWWGIVIAQEVGAIATNLNGEGFDLMKWTRF